MGGAMKTLGRSALGIGVLLLIAFVASVLLFLYALLFPGSWLPFFWAAELSLALVAAIELLARRVRDGERQLLVAAMLAELLGGAFGWPWQAPPWSSSSRRCSSAEPGRPSSFV